MSEEKVKCVVCKEKEVEVLCDFPIHFKQEKDESGLKVEAEPCNLPMCRECSLRVIHMDYCPYHAELYPKLQLPLDYFQKYFGKGEE